MKLVNTLYNLEFDLMENQILVLSIENHLAYRNILEELWKQYQVKDTLHHINMTVLETS